MSKKKSAKNSKKSRTKAKALTANPVAKASKKWKFGGVAVKAIAGAALFQSYALGKSY